MAEAPHSWREVRLGLGVVVAIVLVLLGMWVGRGGNPFAETYSLVLYIENAGGLQPGAAVTLSGLPVGEVLNVDVLGPAPDVRSRYPDRLQGMNIRVVLYVDDRYRSQITDRSVVRIAATGVSGDRHVRIEKGPFGGTPLRNGDRIAVAPALDPEAMLARGVDVVNRVAALNRDAAVVAAKLQSGRGTLGRFLTDPDDNPVAERFERMNELATRILASVDAGQGTVALERRTRGVRTGLDSLEASLRRVQRMSGESGGSLAAFASDTALPKALERLSAHTAALQAGLDRGDGSLGRFLNDPELLDQLGLLTLQLDSLMTQVKADPLGSVDVDLH